MTANTNNESHDKARRRLRGFANHLVGYFAAIAVLAVLNFTFTSDNLWFIAPMIGWSPVLAVHAAFAMGHMELLTRK